MSVAIPEFATAFILVFARVGALVMLLPGIGEPVLPARLRLALALLLTLLLFPTVRGLLPARLAGNAVLPVLLAEVATGLALGLAVRIVTTALAVAGSVIAQELGLSYAMTVDPTQGFGQEAAVSNFLTLLGVTLVFASDVHHLAIRAIGESYALLPPTGFPDPGDAARMAIDAVARAFRIALQISAPFIAFAMLFNLGTGILSRLMPQMQVFFLALPLTILIGVLVLVAVLGAAMGLYIDALGSYLGALGRV